MALRIDQDHSRFKAIVRGKIKQNLRKYVQQGEMIGKKGKDTISIPVPFIDVPHFKYGHKEQGGVGQGEGEPGTQLAPGDVEPGDGHGKAGQGEGEHALEVDVSLDELAQILGEELQLPNIQDRGSEKIVTTKIKYTGIHTIGPESLRHFKRTYKQALRRQIAVGTYDPKNPIVIPMREDRRYRTYRLENLPQTNAVIIYMMDVSGSMGDEQKEIVRIESFWLDAWLRHQYKGLETRYVIHDAVAREVDRETFFHTRESGGTMISSAYKLARDIIKAEYPASSWNIYPFHFSDGDNWSADDTRLCIDLLKTDILPQVNQFAYGQVESPYGSGQFIKDLREQVGENANVALSEIADKDAIYGSIKDFLGEGALMPRGLTPRLEDLRKDIEGYAREFGLDFFETVFEILSYEELNMVAAYGGFPTRYPHWRWGMEYEQLSKGYEYGLSKIYELVINNDPCFAYLLEANAEVDQKLVMAHVYGHCDFFKNNFSFRHTNRRMIDEMANHGTRVRRWIDKLGVEKVEDFVDRCLSLENLIDQHAPHIRRNPDAKLAAEQSKLNDRVEGFKVEREYMRGYVNPREFLDAQRKKVEDERNQAKRFPERPQRDILQFLLEHAPLEEWERDVLSIVRDEAYYFAPQGQTKIMNEGWASFWHSTIMTTRALKDHEIIDYADHHSGTMGTQPGSLNPYKLGIELYRDIEDRWNKGRFGKEWDECDDLRTRRTWDKKLGLGRQKIFEVRKHYNDITFIDEFLTAEFAIEQKMFTYGFNEKRNSWEIMDREFRKVKGKLLQQLTNFGQPVIEVVDANDDNRGELRLAHKHDGLDLKGDYARETLKNLQSLWRRPVNLVTKSEGKSVMIRFDGQTHSEKKIDL